MPTLKAALAALLCAAVLPAQLGQRLGPVIDLTAIVNANPLFASSTHVDFVCRDNAQNWWFIVDGFLLKTDSSFNSLGAIPAVGGMPIYEPSTNRIYFFYGVSYNVAVACVNPWFPTQSWPVQNCPNPWYLQYETANVWGCSYLNLNGGLSIVTQHTEPQQGVVQHAPQTVAADGQGGLLLRTGGGDYRFDPATGIPNPATVTVPDTDFMVLPGSNTAFLATNGSCASGPASKCIRRKDLATGNTDVAFPVDLSIAGPNGQQGGELVHFSAFVEQGEDVGLLVMNDASRTYAYIVDVTSEAEWSGCNGGFTSGPFVEGPSIEASLTVPGTVAWLVLSPSFLQLSTPIFLPGCYTFLDPIGHIALPPQLVPSGQASWSVPITPSPVLDNLPLYFQCIYADLAGLGTTDARSAIIRM